MRKEAIKKLLYKGVTSMVIEAGYNRRSTKKPCSSSKKEATIWNASKLNVNSRQF